MSGMQIARELNEFKTISNEIKLYRLVKMVNDRENCTFQDLLDVTTYTDGELAKMLNVLKSYGYVELTTNKPNWEPVDININATSSGKVVAGRPLTTLESLLNHYFKR